jgi:hypothetical protein
MLLEGCTLLSAPGTADGAAHGCHVAIIPMHGQVQHLQQPPGVVLAATSSEPAASAAPAVTVADLLASSAA